MMLLSLSLQSLELSTVINVLKTPLDASLLLQIIAALEAEYVSSGCDPLPLLRKIALVPRFDTILMFLERDV